MEWNLAEATDYIKFNAIDNEDFLGIDDDRKTLMLNVASRTLARKFPSLVIPDNAVYLFGAALAVAYNDTNKLQQQGISSFSVKGISFTFKDISKQSLEELIPEDVLDIISKENDGINLSVKSVKHTVM